MLSLGNVDPPRRYIWYAGLVSAILAFVAYAPFWKLFPGIRKVVKRVLKSSPYTVAVLTWFDSLRGPLEYCIEPRPAKSYSHPHCTSA
jgi:hypothetical protein